MRIREPWNRKKNEQTLLKKPTVGTVAASNLAPAKTDPAPLARATPLHYVALRAAGAYRKEKPDGNLTTLLTTLIGVERLVRPFFWCTHQARLGVSVDDAR